jgi:hypothetical protein
LVPYFILVGSSRIGYNELKGGRPVEATRHYEDDLRAIGQSVEPKEINYFELKRLGSSFTLRSTAEEADLFPRTLSRLRILPNRSAAGVLIIDEPELDRVTEKARTRRSNPGQLTEFRSISNLLRTVGAYLDANELELVELHKRAISITLLYRDKAGCDRKEDRPISSFYRLFLDLCGKRISSVC